MSSQTEEVNVPDSAGVFLAIAAENYANADLALWRFKQVTEGLPVTAGAVAHLEELRQRRKDAYSDLVTWVMTVEAERLQALKNAESETNDGPDPERARQLVPERWRGGGSRA